MARFDIEPVAAVNGATAIRPAYRMRAYTSSVPGALTVLVHDETGMHGLRLDVAQARALRDAVDAFLDEDAADVVRT